MVRARLHLALWLSGAAGLVWQVVWVRQLGLAFGGSVPSVTLVTTVFMAGLGVGAFVGGRVADASTRPVRLYLACELGTASWGLALIPAMHLLAGSGLGGWALDAHGWNVPSAGARLWQLGVTALALGVPAMWMGASLPLLARPLVGRDVGALGWRSALLVGANTLGAAMGALGTDLWAVPTLGLRLTQCGAAGLGLAAAAVAVGVHPAGMAVPWPEPAPRLGGPPFARVAGAVALAGFAAMGMEVAWFRFFASALGPYRAVYACLVAVVLVGWLAGGLVAGAMARQLPAVGLFAGAQAAVAALVLVGVHGHDSRALLERQLALAQTAPGSLATGALMVNLKTIALGVLPAAIVMGAAFPLASALGHAGLGRVGRRFGGLWLATTTGNALGALATGLVLLPVLGLQNTVLALAAVAAVAPLLLVSRPVFLLALLPVAVAALASPTRLVLASFPYGRLAAEGVLDIREGLNETIVVTGVEGGPARLWTNGHPMSSTSDHAQRYMRLLAHVPLLAMDDPRRALVICFGVGNTAHAASLHPLDRLDIAELSAGVLAEADWFSSANHGVLADPRVVVFVDDGRHVVRRFPSATWDLVTLEPPPIAHAGVASLYTVEFYEAVRARLRPEGWITQWLPAYQVPSPTVLSLVRAFLEVFPNAVLFVGDGKELMLAGSPRPEALTIDVADIERKLASSPGVAADLAAIGIDHPRQLVSLFAADAETLRSASAGSRPMTDDWPIAESSQVSHVAATSLPAGLFAPERWSVFAPGSVGDTRIGARAAANARRWRSADFLRYSTLPGK
ncbi:MAG: hypothetical protein EXR71_04480 [Myxococcales bacterium]|nr:hypothetical protein [Myxococcales bacterium]